MKIEKPFAGLVKLLIERNAGILSGSDVVYWASTMISLGYESPSLCTLAGFDYRESLAECERYFLQALNELNIRIPTGRELIRYYLYDVAHAIINNNLHVFVALEIIHSRILSRLSDSDEFVEWQYLYEGLNPNTLETVSDEEIIELTRQLAINVLADNKYKPDSSAFLVSTVENVNGKSRSE